MSHNHDWKHKMKAYPVSYLLVSVICPNRETSIFRYDFLRDLCSEKIFLIFHRDFKSYRLLWNPAESLVCLPVSVS